MMTIRDWPSTERPREKLLAHGVSAPGDAELLALFFGTGVAGRTAVDVARDALGAFGGLCQATSSLAPTGLLRAERSAFCATHGLGETRYTLLQASLEVSRRHLFTALRETDGSTLPRGLPGHADDGRLPPSPCRERRLCGGMMKSLSSYDGFIVNSINLA